MWLMTAWLIGKTEQDLDDLAAYYASLPSKVAEATGSDEDIELAVRIYKGGIAKKALQHAALAMVRTVRVMPKQAFPELAVSLRNTRQRS